MHDLQGLALLLQIYIISLVGIVGLIFGSFFNVVALRLLSGESFVMPPSKCPKCQTKLKWYDNIPVFAYVFLLRGKCRYCKEKISIQYPIVEFITGVIFLSVFLLFGFSLNTLFLWFLSGCMIIMTLTDLKEQVIFDIVSMPLIPAGLVYSFFDIGHTMLGQAQVTLPVIGFSFALNNSFIAAIIGCIVGALFFEFVSGIGYLMVGQRAFGEGDTIIAAALGAWFGWKAILAIIAISFVFQLIIGIPVVIYNMKKDNDKQSLWAITALLGSILIPLFGRMTHLSDNLFWALFFAVVAFTVAGVAVVVILRRTKERQSFTFLPFGPALILGGFSIMFFGHSILHYFSNFLG